MNPNRARHHTWRADDGRLFRLVDLPHGRSLIKMPTPEDAACASPRNPHACVLAKCSSREADGAPALIGVDKAYIPMYDDKGELVMYRCRVPAATLRAIDHYDRTGEFPKGGFVFVGIPPADKLDSHRARQKRYRERWDTCGGRAGAAPKKVLHLRNASRAAQVFITTNNQGQGDTPVEPGKDTR